MSAAEKALAALEAAGKAATPGPWTAETWVEQDGDGWVARGPLRRDENDDDREPDGPSHLLAQNDADLMALAVNLSAPLAAVARAAMAYRHKYMHTAERCAGRDALFAALDALEAAAEGVV